MSLKSDGYFLAKREIQDLLDRHAAVLKSRAHKIQRTGYAGLENVLIELNVIEELRNHIRNGMLYDTKHDKKEK